MALSPEDVIKKSFSATHLRRGYDETQVDDFLDEVVVELRRLLAENDSLRTDLEDCRASRGLGTGDDSDTFRPATLDTGSDGARDDLDAELEQLRIQDRSAEVEDLRRQLQECQQARAEAEERARIAGQSGADGPGSSSAELEDLRDRVAAADERVRQLEAELEEARDRARRAEEGAAGGASAAAAPGQPGEDPTTIISLAQRLHDEHVAEGESTKARLVDEAETYRDVVVTEADQRRDELVRTGQETHDRLVHEGKAKHDELVQTSQQTHDSLIQEGQQERHRLVSEGQAKHDELVQTGQQTHESLVTEGQTTRDQMVGEAEQQRTSILQDLSARQTALTGRISELRTQESELRQRLRVFLSDQLAKVEEGAD